jgi:phenylalanyl-tRNA synthetase beta chain
LVEEVARLYGYDNFESVPPEIRLERHTTNRRFLLERRLRELLAQVGGMQEVVTYPWVKDRFMEAAGFDPSDALRIAAPPAPDQHSLQPSLIPNLLETIVVNLRYFQSFRTFQVGSVFGKSDFEPLDDPTELLPRQPRHLAGALVGPDGEMLFREAKGLLETLQRDAHIASLSFTSDTAAPWADAAGRLGLLAGGRPAGAIGILSNRAKRLAGIKRGSVILFEFSIDALEPLASRENQYHSLLDYPEVDFDMSLVYSEAVHWDDVAQRVRGMHALIREVIFVDQYRGEGIPQGKKSVTLRLRLGSPTRTLRSDEVSEIGNMVAKELRAAVGAEVRS